nr:MAG TPA: hypothetical protein [Caudoviricetes sp.]
MNISFSLVSHLLLYYFMQSDLTRYFHIHRE